MQSTLGFSSRKLHFYLYHVVKWLLNLQLQGQKKGMGGKKPIPSRPGFQNFSNWRYMAWKWYTKERKNYSIVNAFWKVMIDPRLFYLFWIVLFLNIYLYIFSVQLFLLLYSWEFYPCLLEATGILVFNAILLYTCIVQ